MTLRKTETSHDPPDDPLPDVSPASASVRAGLAKPLALRISLYHWTSEGSIGESIAYELQQLGHEVRRFLAHEPVDPETDIVFTYAPYGRWMHIPRQISRIPAEKRPLLVHWNTEGLPPPSVPRLLQQGLGAARSWFDESLKALTTTPIGGLVRGLDGFFRYRMLRYRYVGDYLRTNRLGIPFLLVDISALHARRLSAMGVPCINIPFGSSIRWHADLKLERDIDVLWIGSHGSWRRTTELNRIDKALAERNIRFHKVDGRSAPFVHGDERTALINRSRIVLNLMRTPYDDNTLRHFIAMPNRALVVSERMLRHNPGLQPGVHYVEAAPDEIPDTIRYYLDHDDLREEIVEKAYQATTRELSMHEMVRKIICTAAGRLETGGSPDSS
jgi:hypothetical protein